MTGHPSFELIKAKSDPISELGNICVSLELLPLTVGKSALICKGKKKTESCNNLIILNKNWNRDIVF